MLNGIAPIFLIKFYKKIDDAQFLQIPVFEKIIKRIGLPPIPIYLDEVFTGVLVMAESKNLDIETEVQTSSTSGEDPIVTQKGISNITTIELLANKNSIGVTLFTALSDFIFKGVTAQEYGISYLNGPITIFNGLLHSFSVDQDADSEKLRITIELTQGGGTVEKSTTPETPKVTGTNLADGTSIPSAAPGSSPPPALSEQSSPGILQP